jgi:O-methyltransferase
MSFFRSVVPSSFRLVYHKFYWFKKNFSDINYFSELKAGHYNGTITYDTDGLTTSHNCDFINEPRFAKAYAAAAATNPWPGFTLQWRVYTVCWFADFVKNLAGEFVECGVNTGAYARAVIDYIDFNSLNKTFYLFDTFEGMVEELVSEEEKKAGVSSYLNGHYKEIYEEVVRTFKPFNTKIIKGAVPYTLNDFDKEKVCFLSIDMNCVAPEIAAAEFFWDKLVSGAVIILDDYGFPQHIQQKLAFDKFAKEKGVEILTLPTAQGIFFKP